MIVLIGNFTLVHAFAGDCDHCGNQRHGHKVCRLICEVKEIEITCWGCKCEDICVPHHSQRNCKHCEQVCGDGEHCGQCGAIASHPKKFVWYDWTPDGASLKTRKRLMRKTVTRKVPTYRWVVEDSCLPCEPAAPAAAPMPDADAPSPPDVEARLKHVKGAL
jgi:hypothetical protein